MSSTTNASADTAVLVPNIDPSPGVNFTGQVPTHEPLFPADVIEECMQEYLRDYTFLEQDLTPRKRWSRRRVRLGSSRIQPLTKGSISGRWSAATTDSEYFSESALFTDGSLGNRGRVFTVRVHSSSSSLSDYAGGRSPSAETSKEEYDGGSSDGAWSDDDQPEKEDLEKGCGDGDGNNREDSPHVPHAAVSYDEQSASDGGYHVDYDDDSEDPTTYAGFFSDSERDLGKYLSDAVFYSIDHTTDGHDTDYDDGCYRQAPRSGSPDIGEIDQRINEYLWSTK